MNDKHFISYLAVIGGLWLITAGSLLFTLFIR